MIEKNVNKKFVFKIRKATISMYARVIRNDKLFDRILIVTFVFGTVSFFPFLKRSRKGNAFSFLIGTRVTSRRCLYTIKTLTY